MILFFSKLRNKYAIYKLSPILLSVGMCYGQNYTEVEIAGIHFSKTAGEGDMYKDITNDIQYIGASDGSLKILITKYAKIIHKTGSYTLKEVESGMAFTIESTQDVEFTLPAGTPIGTHISIYQTGDGKITIIGAAGVTVFHRLNYFQTAGKHAGVGVLCTALNTYHLTGDLKN